MKRFFFGVCLLLFFSQCKKTKTDPQRPDFRDALVGTYVTTSYSTASYPTPPTYFDTIIYNHDTLLLHVTKLESDTSTIIVDGDTLPFSSMYGSNYMFMSGCCHYEHIAQFNHDTITYIRNTGGSPASSSSQGQIGKKQ